MLGHRLRWLSLLCLAPFVVSNVEKTIFQAPASVLLPFNASINHHHLISLNHRHNSVRTNVQAAFPTPKHPKGLESWFVLDGLSPGQRYEVRVCWLATQPTAFWLYTHTATDTHNTPNLLASISAYARQRGTIVTESEEAVLQSRRQIHGSNAEGQSFLFLQVHAAAEYFSLNKTLMEHVPPVLVDVILDPYLLNIFPQSLVPTAGYIIVIAVAAWVLSRMIASFLWQSSASQTLVPEEAISSPKIEKKRQ